MLIYITKEYRVIQIRIRSLLLWTIILLFIQVILLKYWGYLGSFSFIIAIICSILAGPILTFIFTSKVLFSEEVIGQILSQLKYNDHITISKFNNAIRSRINARSIILKSSNKKVLNELILIMNTYESCWPYQIDFYPNIQLTLNLFEEVRSNPNNLFQEYDLNLDSFYLIFLINSIYYTRYHSIQKSEHLDKPSSLIIPDRLKIQYAFATMPVNKISNEIITKIINKRENLKIDISELLELKENTDKVLFEYVKDCVQDYEMISNHIRFKEYKSLLDILDLTILSNCIFLQRSILNKKRKRDKVIFSEEEIYEIESIKNDFIGKELNPLLEVYRKMLLDIRIKFSIMLEVLSNNTIENASLINEIIFNYFTKMLYENDIVGFKFAFQKLEKKIVIKESINANLKVDAELQYFYYKNMFAYFSGDLSSEKLYKWREVISNKCHSDSCKQWYQNTLFKLSLIIADNDTIDWIEGYGVLPAEEIQIIKENYRDPLTFVDNRTFLGNNLINYNFPVRIDKSSIAYYIDN